eukprot:SAG31_NODE_31231_length_370_cov_1.143911_2_plen_51_part_01
MTTSEAVIRWKACDEVDKRCCLYARERDVVRWPTICIDDGQNGDNTTMRLR